MCVYMCASSVWGIPHEVVNVLFRSRTLQIFNNCYNNVKGWLNIKGMNLKTVHSSVHGYRDAHV